MSALEVLEPIFKVVPEVKSAVLFAFVPVLFVFVPALFVFCSLPEAVLYGLDFSPEYRV